MDLASLRRRRTARALSARLRRGERYDGRPIARTLCASRLCVIQGDVHEKTYRWTPLCPRTKLGRDLLRSHGSTAPNALLKLLPHGAPCSIRDAADRPTGSWGVILTLLWLLGVLGRWIVRCEVSRRWCRIEV